MSEYGTFAGDAEPFTEREAWLWLIAECAFKAYRKGVGHFIVNKLWR